MLTSSVFVLFLLVNFTYAENLPTVVTSLGKIRGHYLVSDAGQNYSAYEGIPYALPPVGDKRFEPPQAVEPWSEELVADKFRSVCLGHTRNLGSDGDYLTGIEDCLYLNVYVPKRETDELLPVIFWIYGGAFQYSTLEGTEQQYLMDHKVIFVSINYRHGALGFLSTEDEVVPGNMGLKDQSFALQWVSKNIKSFGGDPKKIMLAGLSAGGASVHYHYLSPMSKGLFHTGLSLSGTAFDSWTQARNSREKAIKLGELMKCPTSNMKTMLECLKKLPAQDIVKAQATFMPWHLTEWTPFGPVVEKSSPKPFIDRSPIEIIKSGDVYDVPWITGVVSAEGLHIAAEFLANKTALQELDENWESMAPHLLQYYYTIPKEKHAVVAKQIREHYFGSKPINNETVWNLIRAIGDRISVVGAEKAAREQASVNKSPVMFYYYSFRANESWSDLTSNSRGNYGVSPGDDVYLVHKSKFVNPTKTEENTLMHEELIQFWITIAFTGFPHRYPQWQRVDSNNKALKYFHIKGPNTIFLETNTNLGQRKFWNTIPFSENQVISHLSQQCVKK